MNSILEVKPVSKIRANLWQLATGEVVGFGAILAPGGLYYCFTCSSADCEHTTSVDEAWVSGKDSVLEDYKVPAHSGCHAGPTVSAPPFTLIEPTEIELNAVENGSKPGAWKARSIEELPSGWTRQVVL